MSELLDITGLSKMLNTRRSTVRQWRLRYEDFPEPALGDVNYPWYHRDEVVQWFLEKWPERGAEWPSRLHRFEVNSNTGAREVTTVDFGPILEARGYLRAVRMLQYRDWRTWHTKEGFVAERGNDTHIWYLDPTTEDPDDWFVYHARIKAGFQQKESNA